MDKVKKVCVELVWLITALFGVGEQFLIDSLKTIFDMLKATLFFAACLPLMMVYQWITKKEYEQ